MLKRKCSLQEAAFPAQSHSTSCETPAEQMCGLRYTLSVIKSRSYWAKKWNDLEILEGTPYGKCLASNSLFLKSKACQLSCICWAQLSRCHLERKVNPQWLNTQPSNRNTAHAADYRKIRLMLLTHTAGGETKNPSLTAAHVKSSALKKKKET